MPLELTFLDLPVLPLDEAPADAGDLPLDVDPEDLQLFAHATACTVRARALVRPLPLRAPAAPDSAGGAAYAGDVRKLRLVREVLALRAAYRARNRRRTTPDTQRRSATHAEVAAAPRRRSAKTAPTTSRCASLWSARNMEKWKRTWIFVCVRASARPRARAHARRSRPEFDRAHTRDAVPSRDRARLPSQLGCALCNDARTLMNVQEALNVN
jgi:hypothetical protein